MLNIEKIKADDKKNFYKDLNKYLFELIKDEGDFLANICNASALLFHQMPNINWAGFYFFKENELVLGPFQGKPACVRIALGKGVCGTAAKKKITQIVKNVHHFPGHIACDADSQSEIVVPIMQNNKLVGVLDIDSPVIGRFDEIDAIGLKEFIKILNQFASWPEFDEV